LVIASRFGQGRVVACLTSAGSSWNDWAQGLAVPSYVVFITELPKYLAGGARPTGLTLGTPLVIVLDARRFEPTARVFYRDKAGKDVALAEKKALAANEHLMFTFIEAREPGLYSFEFPLRNGKGTVRRGFVFNVDALAECNLLRAAEKDLPAGSPRAKGKLTLER
jgi:hypothetical protein